MPTSKSSTLTELPVIIEETCHCADCHYKMMLERLLAIIHRDGGQFTTLAGLATSVEDAMKKVENQRKELIDYRRPRSNY